MDFEIPYSADEIDAACNELLQKNGIEDGYIRPIAWRGSGMMGVSAQNSGVHMAIAAWEWPGLFLARSPHAGHSDEMGQMAPSPIRRQYPVKPRRRAST